MKYILFSLVLHNLFPKPGLAEQFLWVQASVPAPVFLVRSCSLVLSGSAWQRGTPQGASGQPGGSLAAATSTEATHSGATSAKCATDTLVKYVKGMGPALVPPLTCARTLDLSQGSMARKERWRGFLSFGILLCKGWWLFLQDLLC